MELNYIAIIVCVVLSMVIGFVWYGPLFGSLWMRINNLSPMDQAARKEMQKKAGPLYIVQMLLTFLEVWVFAHIAGHTVADGILSGLWVWAGFIVPTLAGAIMWSNKSRKAIGMQLLIQGGYQLVLFAVFGLILGLWR